MAQGDDSARAHRHVRPAVSQRDVVGHDLQRRGPRRSQDRASVSRCCSTGAARRRCRPAAATCSISTRPKRTGSPIASPTAPRSNLTEKLGPQLLARGSRHAEPAAGLRRCRLDDEGCVGPALRQVRHLGDQARRQRAAHAHRRRRAQESDRLPLPLARSRRARDSGRQAACCSRPTTTRPRAAASTASPTPATPRPRRS